MSATASLSRAQRIALEDAETIDIETEKMAVHSLLIARGLLAYTDDRRALRLTDAGRAALGGAS